MRRRRTKRNGRGRLRRERGQDAERFLGHGRDRAGARGARRRGECAVSRSVAPRHADARLRCSAQRPEAVTAARPLCAALPFAPPRGVTTRRLIRALLPAPYIPRQLARECTIDRLSGNDTGIALLKLNRPAAKNAIGATPNASHLTRTGKVLIGQFQESLQEIQGDKSIRVVVLRSEVPGVFCAGADLKARASLLLRWADEAAGTRVHVAGRGLYVRYHATLNVLKPLCM